jgi:hypothetical protein
MPIYHCSICNVEFKKKWNYDYHISRKNPCKMEDEQESENNTCRHCHKTYSSKSNLNKHLKICKFMKNEEIDQDVLIHVEKEEKKEEETEEKEEEKKKISQEYEEILLLKQQIEQMSSLLDTSLDGSERSRLSEEKSSKPPQENISMNEFKDSIFQLKKDLLDIKSMLNEKNTELSVQQTYNISNHYTFLTQIQQNTNVTNFGSEIMDELPPEFCFGLFTSPKHSVPRLIEKIHFDKESPSNMNIILPNKDLPYVYVYENDKWVIANKQTALNELMDTNMHRVDSLYDHLKECLGESMIQSYEKYSSEMEQNLELKTDIQKDISYVLEKGSKQIIEKMDKRPLLETPPNSKKEGIYIRDHPGFPKKS